MYVFIVSHVSLLTKIIIILKKKHKRLFSFSAISDSLIEKVSYAGVHEHSFKQITLS